MTTWYTVVIEGRFREVYSVPAWSKEQAHDEWMDYEPSINEVIDAEVISVSEEARS